jgi:hypothetical protein
MTHVPGTVSAKYILHGLGRIGSPRVRLPLVGPEEWEAALIEDELALVRDVDGADFSNFRPDRNAAAGGAFRRCTARPDEHERLRAARPRRAHCASSPSAGSARSVAT